MNNLNNFVKIKENLTINLNHLLYFNEFSGGVTLEFTNTGILILTDKDAEKFLEFFKNLRQEI